MLFLAPVITIYILVMAFIFGAVFASFLGCMGWRITKGESVLKGRSHCDYCGYVLAWRDLIPIVSFVLGKGRCAYCKKALSKVLLYGEISLALLFVLVTLRYDVTPELFLYLFFICILYLISITDIYDQMIPDSALLIAVIVRLLWFFVTEPFGWRGLLGLIGNGLSVSLPLLLLVLLMEKIRDMEMMGGGDIKLLFVMGLYIGWANNLLALFLGCLTAIIYGSLKQRKEGKEVYIPFGPFLSLGAVFALLIGDGLIQWYLSLFI